MEFIQSELQREITEALIKHKNITAVSNFIFERTQSGLNVTFNVDTTDCDIKSGVVFSG